MNVKELDAAQLATWLSTGEPMRLIDVRTPAEASRGIIPDAENVPLHLLPLRADEVPARPKLVFYCRSGVRSEQACVFMEMRGHPDVYNLRGGINSWVRSGLPLDALKQRY
jgi:rhodanese-related sulfurtransferase